MTFSTEAVALILVVLISSAFAIFFAFYSCRRLVEYKNREIVVLRKEIDALKELIGINRSRIKVKDETIVVLQEVVDYLNPKNIH